ncbi:putative 5'-Nucleotidase domain protein [Treponema primitia ZAS-2]|uniref:Putative 5'-Nucleotidase domain protein n=1 Tax=Treponema primitia (strain ATCC BAA-887 / DSM 12427 / ZAS-2) TaxID=545694 RepID=F5YIA6_TREPZ|nr:bifunctional UDP-sugar hydrolase/5'-nucleotidase [Treponema primitia]AEF84201.1 putative 5'-Nucleotidase domain protein [Treponema primitia ZAS-2]
MKSKRMLLSVLLLFSAMGAVFAGGRKEPVENVITILHTNDVHSNVAIEPYVKGYADSLRAEKRDVVIVSAGDAFDGTPFASLSDGRDVATVMNMVGYEVFAMGNHEQFDSVDFKMLSKLVKFPILAANIGADWKTNIPEIKDFVIKSFGKTKIAFIGITSGTTGDEAVKAAERARTESTAKGANVFIAVTHLGVQDADETIRSTYLAEHCPWLSLIIDAHCHTAHQNGLLYNGVLIGETGEYGNNLGVIELTVKGSEVLNVTARLIPIKGHEAESGITPDAEVQAFIDQVNARNAAYLNETVFSLSETLYGTRDYSRRAESVFGNLLTDSMRWKTGVQIGLLQGPAIRANLNAGEVIRNQLLTALFPDAPVCTFTLKGEVIRSALENGVSAFPNENNSFIHISGILVEFDQNAPAGNRITSIKMEDGSPFDPDAVYTCASKSDSLWFIPNWEVLTPGKDFELGHGTICEVLDDYISSGITIPTKIAGRIAPIK